MTEAAFIKKYKFYAMQSAKNGVLPSVILAQAALESGWGESTLSKSYNNFFGIKAGKDWHGPVADMKTLEYYNITPSNVIDTFRVYTYPWKSFEDHTAFLSTYRIYADDLQEENPYYQATKLQESGYATDPNYAKKLIQIIEKHSLWKLDTKKKQMKNLQITAAVLTAIVAAITIYLTAKQL